MYLTRDILFSCLQNLISQPHACQDVCLRLLVYRVKKLTLNLIVSRIKGRDREKDKGHKGQTVEG